MCPELSLVPQALLHPKLHQAPCQPPSVFGVLNIENCFRDSRTTSCLAYYLPQSRISTTCLPQPRHVTKINSRQTPLQPTDNCLPDWTRHPCQFAISLSDLEYTALTNLCLCSTLTTLHPTATTMHQSYQDIKAHRLCPQNNNSPPSLSTF
jgi:hypothetical protein